MTKGIGWVTALFIAIGMQAQDRGYVGASLGSAVPMGNFASEDAENDQAGLAREGFLAEATGAFRIGKHLGASASIRSAINSVNAQVIANSIVSETGATVKVEATPWTATSFLLGGFATFPVSNDASLDVKVLGGLGLATSPELRIERGPLTVTGSPAGGVAWTYVLSAGLRFGLTRRLCLLSAVEYQSMRPEFRGSTMTTNTGITEEVAAFTQPMAWLNVSLGLGFRFGS